MRSILVYAIACVIPLVQAIRGVAPKDEAKYIPDANNQWRCLGNPEIVLDFHQVNDDFCDCPDGSDEPGTSACAKGRFFCENLGFKSSYIPSFKVNDGVCDYETCCDGSDEWSGIVSCENRCAELNAAHAAKQLQEQELLAKGVRARKIIESRSNQEKLKVKDKIRELRRSIKHAKFTLEGLEEYKEDIQDIPETPVDVVKPQLDAVKSHLEAQKQAIDQLQEKIDNLEKILAELAEGYNPNFNDPVVKNAVTSYQNYAAEKETEATNGDSEGLINQLEEGIGALEIGQGASEVVDCTIKKALSIVFEQALDSLIASPKRNSHKYSRSQLSSDIEAKQSEISKLEAEKSELEEDLVDPKYGPGGILRSYNGQCLTRRIGDYDYKFCFTGSINQIGGGNSVLIGTMDRVEEQPDGSLNIFYERGARCWNGPIRKAIAHVECGEIDDVLVTSEPEKCEYFFKVVSPIACKEPELIKDEL